MTTPNSADNVLDFFQHKLEHEQNGAPKQSGKIRKYGKGGSGVGGGDNMEGRLSKVEGKVEIIMWLVPIMIAAATWFTNNTISTLDNRTEKAITGVRQEIRNTNVDLRQEMREMRKELLDAFRSRRP